MPDDKTANALMDAVEAGFEEQVSQTADLVRFPSTRGAEAPAQDYMARQMRERGLDVDRFKVDIDEIRHWPGFSPVHVNYDNAWNVVGSGRVENPKGRSLILNGHVDVVPAGPLDMWSTPPFEPRIENGWMYGRGAGDMKAGLIACLAAMDAVERAGFGLTADVFVQSVIEEECTGNGALACLARGYKADAALIPEPQNQTMIRAQIGVIWFQVNVRGIPVHVADAGAGANAIEAAYTVMQALHELEHEWNSRKDQYPPYETVDHPINLNVGRIEGGDWASSVPAWCTFDVRVAIYPGQDIAEAKREIEETIRLASRRNAFLQNNPPQIVYNGFEAEGYILKNAEEPVGMLARSHKRVFGEALEEMACTATTDARFFGLYADTPALVYGPTAELIHGFDERVSLDSLLSVTKAMTLFLADWCGVESR